MGRDLEDETMTDNKTTKPEQYSIGMGHEMIIGPTMAGKTVFVGQVIADAAKNEPDAR